MGFSQTRCHGASGAKDLGGANDCRNREAGWFGELFAFEGVYRNFAVYPPRFPTRALKISPRRSLNVETFGAIASSRAVSLGGARGGVRARGIGVRGYICGIAMCGVTERLARLLNFLSVSFLPSRVGRVVKFHCTRPGTFSFLQAL